MRIDVNAFIGQYPFRDIGATDATSLVTMLAGAGVTDAWVSYLPAVFWQDPAAGNTALFKACDANSMLRAVAAVHPGMPGWIRALDEAVAAGVSCVRCDPSYYGLPPTGQEVQSLLAGCADRGISLMFAVRLEDGRQRHPNDVAPPLEPWMVRTLVRSHPDARLIVTHADREFIEQVHFGSTPSEASRILWDISWIWGPPEDHLALLVETIGAERFAFGTGAPLRIPDGSAVKLELLDAAPAARALIESGNAIAFARQ